MNITNLPSELKTLIFNQLDDVDKHTVLLVNKDCSKAIKTTDFHMLIAKREQVTKSWLGYFITNINSSQNQSFIGIQLRPNKNLSSLVISLISQIVIPFFSKTDKEREIAKQIELNKEFNKLMLANHIFTPADYEWQKQIDTLKNQIFPRMHGRNPSR